MITLVGKENAGEGTWELVYFLNLIEQVYSLYAQLRKEKKAPYERVLQGLTCYLSLFLKTTIFETRNNKCSRGCGEKGILMHRWECKLVRPLGKQNGGSSKFKNKTPLHSHFWVFIERMQKH